MTPATGAWSTTGALLNLPAVFIIVSVFDRLLVIGIKESAQVNNAIVAIKLAIIVAFIVVGVWFVDAANWVTSGNPDGRLHSAQSPARPSMAGAASSRGAAVVFFAYIGFDAVSTAAQEARESATRHADRHPRIARDLHDPLCARSASSLRGSCPLTSSNVPDPIALGVDVIGIGWLPLARQARRDPRVELGHPGAPARPVADLLFDGARLAAAAFRRRRSSDGFERPMSRR